jgi:hypothetical protein
MNLAERRTLTSSWASESRFLPRGDDRSRTGVDGFAGRCVATPPRRQDVLFPKRIERAAQVVEQPIDVEAASLTDLFGSGYQLFSQPLGAL